MEKRYLEDWLSTLAAGGGFENIIFDEYHLFDEEECAIAMSFIFILGKIAELYPPRFYLLSGTPDDTIVNLVHEIISDVKIIKERVIKEETTNNGRIISKRKNIHIARPSVCRKGLLRVLNENLDNLVDFIEENHPVLFIFDSIRDAVLFDDLMLDYFDEKEIGRNTGLETRIISGHRFFDYEKLEKGDYKVIVSTSKIEVGVDYPVDVAFIETGPHSCNAWQRIGRVGRKDTLRKESDIFVCITGKNKYEMLVDLIKCRSRNPGININKTKKLLAYHMNLIFDALKGQRKKSDVKKASEEILRKYNIEPWPFTRLKRLLVDICKLNENIAILMIERLKFTFSRFRPPTFKKVIILKSKRGELPTEYDVLRALLRFGVMLKKNKLIFLSGEKGVKPEKVVVVLDFPLSDHDIQLSLREYMNVVSSSETYRQFYKKLITNKITNKCKNKIINTFNEIFSQYRMGIKDIQVAESEILKK